MADSNWVEDKLPQNTTSDRLLSPQLFQRIYSDERLPHDPPVAFEGEDFSQAAKSHIYYSESFWLQLHYRHKESIGHLELLGPDHAFLVEKWWLWYVHRASYWGLRVSRLKRSGVHLTFLFLRWRLVNQADWKANLDGLNWQTGHSSYGCLGWLLQEVDTSNQRWPPNIGRIHLLQDLPEIIDIFITQIHKLYIL